MQNSTEYSGTVSFEIPAGSSVEAIRTKAEAKEINFRYGKNSVHISLDQAIQLNDLADIAFSNREPLALHDALYVMQPPGCAIDAIR